MADGGRKRLVRWASVAMGFFGLALLSAGRASGNEVGALPIQVQSYGYWVCQYPSDCQGPFPYPPPGIILAPEPIPVQPSERQWFNVEYCQSGMACSPDQVTANKVCSDMGYVGAVDFVLGGPAPRGHERYAQWVQQQARWVSISPPINPRNARAALAISQVLCVR